MTKRFATVAILLLAFLGLADSVYLTQSETNGSPLLCDINSLTGCNIVAQSPYSQFLGIPLAEYGLLFYVVLFVIAALELAVLHHLVRRVMQGLAMAGFLMSAYFVAIQLFVIKALCIYCLLSAFIVLCIFFLAFLLEPIRKSPPQTGSPVPPPASPRPRFSMPPSA